MSLFLKYSAMWDMDLGGRSRERGEIPHWFGNLAWIVVGGLCKLLFRYRVDNRQKLRAFKGASGALVICNHTSFFDVVFMYLAARPSQWVRLMGRDSLFGNAHGLLGQALSRVGAFPVKRDTADMTSIKRAVRMLKNDELVGILPEGTRRGKTDRVPSIHAGASVIARMAKVPILPMTVRNAEKIKEKGLDPRTDFSIHTIIVAGEPGGSIQSTREAIEDLWDAKVVDFFGLSDIYGACAAMCEAKDGLHIVEDQILVETVDPATGEVLEPGEQGELVYTTLMKKARPMIRFRTGDIGYVSTEKCECGRTLARIHVTGRKDEMFIVGAVNVFPTDIEYVVRAEQGLTGEYSIRVYDQDFTTKYEVSVERAQGSEEPYDEVARRVENALKTHTGVRPAKVIVYDAGRLGTSSEHKASRFVDERTSAK